LSYNILDSEIELDLDAVIFKGERLPPLTFHDGEPTDPSAGSCYFDSQADKIHMYNGKQWVQLAGGRVGINP
jgi:hypothetical protein